MNTHLPTLADPATESPNRSAPAATEMMLDLETLDTRPTAVVTELAAAVFHRNRNTGCHIHDEIEFHLDPWDQIRRGRTIDPDTIAFHQKHQTLPRGKNTDSLTEAIDSLRILAEGIETVWIWGADFDSPILKHLHDQLGLAMPWRYAQVSDARTVWKLAFPGKYPKPRPHTAMDDVRAAITDLHNARTTLNR